MSENEKLEQMKLLLGSSCPNEETILVAFLNQAKARVLSRRYPYGIPPNGADNCYDNLQVELAIVLFAQSGAEGQSSHSENGVNRAWRSVDEILNDITPMAGVIYEKSKSQQN